MTDEQKIAAAKARIKELELLITLWSKKMILNQKIKKVLFDHLATLHEHHPDKMKKIVASFRSKFGIKDTKITKHITNFEHGEFLTFEISKILK